MKKTSAVIFTILFLAIVFGLGILSFAGFVNYRVNDVVINNEWIPELGNKFETDIAATFFQKFAFVSLNGAVRKFLGQQEMNGVVKLNNGYLTETLERCPDDIIGNFVSRTVSFNEYLGKRGTSLLFAVPPYTVSKYDPELPVGVEDFSNDNLDRLLSGMRKSGIETVDFREIINADGIEPYSMVYKTDHHWTTEAAFYAYRFFENYIAEKTGCVIDSRISDIGNYNVTFHEKWQLGSRGQRVGIYFAGMDDFVFISPDFETKIEDSSGKVGNVYDYFFTPEYLENRDISARYAYDYAMGGPAFAGHYKNLNSTNDVKVMMISDSYARAVVPYLLMQFSEVYTILDGYIGDLKPELIEEYDPDIVIMLYYPKYINKNSGSFDFHF